ncbi:MAG: glycosyltransferase family 4 protein [bacterium]|nr:glycosyltransferase family 4 protein [bacterium]
MNVGIITDSYLPIVGGAEIHIANLARVLTAAGIQIEIYTITEGWSEYDQIRIHRYPRSPNHQRYRYFLYIPYLLRTVKNLYQFSKDKNVLHCHYTSYLTAISVLVSKFRHIPVVVTLHGAGTLDSSTRRSRFGWIYRFLSLKFATYIISTSNEMASLARKYVPSNKITVIPNGVDTRRFSPRKMQNKGNKIIVLTARRLVPKNGVQYLIEAIPAVLNQIDDIEFHIIGTGELEEYIRKRVKLLEIEQYVKFFGKIENEQLPDYLSNADIVVFPSRAESTSIACLEAMAMGKAVIASAVGGYPDLLGDNQRGILVNLFDTETSTYSAPLSLPDEKLALLANAIVRLAKNQMLREELGTNAREFVVTYYDWRELTRRIIEIYTTVIRSKV